MDTNGLIEALISFGLTRQEALIYLTLLEHGTQTGYEVAKETGISRSNAYSGLSGLVEKGAAFLMDGKTKKYAPVEPDDFCENKIRTLTERKNYLKEHLPRGREENIGYVTLNGDANIWDTVHNMLHNVEKRLYFSVSASHFIPFEELLTQLIQRGRKVVILTDEPIQLEGAQIYVTESRGDQIGLITDSAHVLTGEVGLGKQSVCLYSGQPNLVRVFKDSLRNEIKLIELLRGEHS